MAYPTKNCNADVQLLGRNLQPRIQTYATQMPKSTTHIPESTQPFVVADCDLGPAIVKTRVQVCVKTPANSGLF